MAGWIDVSLDARGSVDPDAPVDGQVEFDLGGMRSGNPLIDREAERRLDIEEVLDSAVEAFYTGTAAVLSPVTTINYQGVDYPIGDGQPGPRAEKLRQALTSIQLQEQPDHWGWVKEL